MGKRKTIRMLFVATMLTALTGSMVTDSAPVHGHAAPQATATPPNETTALDRATTADWLEPRGLNIVDLVGQVPDAYLEGAIIYYSTGDGIIRYQSGTRVGSTVTITATVYPRRHENGDWKINGFGCLGLPAHYDQWPSVAPESTMRLYDGDQDITGNVTGYQYLPAGKNLPSANSRAWERYDRVTVTPASFSGDALQLPANMGCSVWDSGENRRELTAVYTIQTTSPVTVTFLGSETFTFHSYIGTGSAGLLDPLVDQLRSTFSNRHEKFSLSPPAEADYFFLNFPPQPVDPYTPGNVDRPSAGTYRIVGDGGMSVDHVASMGLPLYGHWRDSDKSSGSVYLPHYRQPDQLASPEYFVPTGVPYHDCMVTGGCPASLLNQIHDTTMTMEILYLKVERNTCFLDRIPLRAVGPAWSPPTLRISQVPAAAERSDPRHLFITPSQDMDFWTYLPLITYRFCVAIPPDDPTGCPCGWFTPEGRMVDFIPRP